MEKFATENLILLEFLVDQLNLDYDVQKDLKSITGDTCVSFQFLDNAPLYICEQDFTIKHPCAIRDQSSIKNGKSCLFSLTPKQAEEASKRFDVYVEIFKKMQAGVLPEKLPIGESLISIVNLFKELVASISESGESPSAKTLKDCFKITNNRGVDVGHISVYIRMSCFGKLIVTQFQMNLEDKSVQFRAKEGHYLFKYNKGKGEPSCAQYKKNQQSVEPPCMNVKQKDEEVCPLQPCIFHPQPKACPMPPSMSQQPTYMIPQSQCPMPQPQSPCGICGMPLHTIPPCNICGVSQPPSCPVPQPPCGSYGLSQPPCAMPQAPCGICGSPQPSCAMPQPPCAMPQPPCAMPQPPYGTPDIPCIECSAPPDPRAAYQEIGASMGGNALTIRVHKGKGKIEQITDPDMSDSDECSCGMENLNKKGPIKPPPANCTPIQSYSQPPCLPLSPCSACNSPPCYTSPPAYCTMQNALSMRPGAPNPNSPFGFKMGGCGAGASNNITVNPPHCVTKDGTCFTEISDPNKDIFVLRIGKKSEGVDKKNNLELELCTPKGPPCRPLPKKETRETQYCLSDLPVDAAAGKKGKGKGKGKKGKGKKGKGGKKGGKGGKKGKGGKGGKKGGKKGKKK